MRPTSAAAITTNLTKLMLKPTISSHVRKVSFNARQAATPNSDSILENLRIRQQLALGIFCLFFQKYTETNMNGSLIF